jgi:SAM-dependent methyltransferase
MSDQQNRAANAWTDYWRSGESASCHRSGVGEVSFEPVWAKYFDTFQDADLLDLATGNGTVVRWALISARRRDATFRITGVDYADVTPAADAASARFLGRVNMESLPFENESFDAISSQFGFEYADEAGAAAEASRVLRPGGALRFVMHARGGEVSRDIGERTDRLALVLGEGEILLRIRNLARGRAAGLPETPVALEQLSSARSRVEVLRSAPPDNDAALFYADGIADLWNNRTRYDPKDLLRSIEDGIARAQAVQFRQRAMLAAARSADDMVSLRGRFAALGVSTAPAQPLTDEQGRQIAWLLDGKK